MKKLIRIFDKRKSLQKSYDNYNTDTMTALYFPSIAKEIKNRKKVEKFFSNLNTECY